jgi:predicted peroxiredoxin
LINLSTGLEDAERVTVAFLVATAAQRQGKQVVIWTTKDAVRLGLPGEAVGVGCNGCPPLEQLFEQFADNGGQLWLCPYCVDARDLRDADKTPNATIAGATPVWEWVGDHTTVFSY